MKVIWKGKTEFLALTNGKEYTVLSIEKGWYRLIDDSGEDYANGGFADAGRRHFWNRLDGDCDGTKATLLKIQCVI